MNIIKDIRKPLTRHERDFCEVALEHTNKNLIHHGIEHIDRVLYYAKLIMANENINSKYYNDILAAATFHDIGRVHDRRDDYHGKRSAQMFNEKIYDEFWFLNLDSIVFAIENHNNFLTPDGKLPVVSNYKFDLGINPTISAVLWDADRLDIARVEKLRGVLDSKYMSTNFARKYMNTRRHLEVYENYAGIINDSFKEKKRVPLFYNSN